MGLKVWRAGTDCLGQGATICQSCLSRILQADGGETCHDDCLSPPKQRNGGALSSAIEGRIVGQELRCRFGGPPSLGHYADPSYAHG
jgi:hypothetical protein